MLSFIELLHNCKNGPHKIKCQDDEEITFQLDYKSRYAVIQSKTSEFWERWTREVTPKLVGRQVWHEKDREVREGDLVADDEKTASLEGRKRAR